MKIVIIQKQLLKDLKFTVQLYNKKNKQKLKLDVAAFFLSLFNSIPSYYREGDSTDEVHLSSQRLKKYNDGYSLYYNFFIKQGYILKVKSYGADIQSCNIFKMKDKYRLDKAKSYQITDKVFLKKFDEKGRENYHLEKMAHCKKKRPHLAKFFDNKLSINTVEAYNEVDDLLEKNLSYKKDLSSLVLIKEFHTKEWKYSIKEETDNRLHSNLTRSSKLIRKHIRYNNKPIAGADIKTSQPFFLCVLIKAILKKDNSVLEKTGALKIIPDKVVDRLFNLDLDREELIGFVQLILDKDFYNEFEKLIEIKLDDNGMPLRNVVCKKKKGSKRTSSNNEFRKDVPYDSNRELVKAVVMEIFYSSTKTTVPEAAVFRKHYPSVNKIFKCFEESNIKLHRVLQYIEAYSLLDCAALNIHQKYPEMPLFSIHDSLVTTLDWIDLLKQEMKEQLYLITSLRTNIDIEYWKGDT